MSDTVLRECPEHPGLTAVDEGRRRIDGDRLMALCHCIGGGHLIAIPLDVPVVVATRSPGVLGGEEVIHERPAPDTRWFVQEELWWESSHNGIGVRHIFHPDGRREQESIAYE